MKISIIGGNGGMGKLLTNFLEKDQNIKVFLLGRKSSDFIKRIKESDVIFFSIPIFAMNETLNSIKNINLKDKLLIDLSSIVDENNKKIKLLSSRAHFIHMMFGPDIYDLKNQNIIVSDYEKDKDFKIIIDLFKKEKANITISTAEKHDHMMSIIQALSQFTSISLAKTISEEKTNLKELDNFSSITFSMNKDLINRIFFQKPELWSAMQFNNVFFRNLLNKHIKNIKELEVFVNNKDYKGFEKMFNSVSGFWKKENFELILTKEKSKIKVLNNCIGTLGPKGSYSEQAAFQYSNKNNKILFDSINDVLSALSLNKIKEAVLPLENSTHGTVLETLDGLYANKLKINKEIILKIEHCLIGLDKKISADKVKYIYSHTQALGQCKKYLQTKYPKAKLILTPSTSTAIKKIKDDGLLDSLAIGSKFAANLYNLSVLEENIQDEKNNQTLFVVISKKSKEFLPFTFFVIDTNTDKAGILYEILSIFKEQNINLSKIESRPSKKQLGKYIFYIKADISSMDEKRELILKELKKLGKITLITN